jgi:lactoylglutathione lyase
MARTWTVSFDHVAIRVRDIRRSIAFYRDVMGLELRRAIPDAENPAQVWFPGLQLIQMSDAETPNPGWRLAHVAFRVSDTAAAVADITARGYKFLPHEPGKPYFFEDPDGVVVELLV